MHMLLYTLLKAKTYWTKTYWTKTIGGYLLATTSSALLFWNRAFH